MSRRSRRPPPRATAARCWSRLRIMPRHRASNGVQVIQSTAMLRRPARGAAHARSTTTAVRTVPACAAPTSTDCWTDCRTRPSAFRRDATPTRTAPGTSNAASTLPSAGGTLRRAWSADHQTTSAPAMTSASSGAHSTALPSTGSAAPLSFVIEVALSVSRLPASSP